MNPGIIERAYQLARSGEFRTMTDLKRRLSQEGYDSIPAHLGGRLTRSQLAQMMKHASGVDERAAG